MESRARACSRVHGRHETLGNYSPDRAGTPSPQVPKFSRLIWPTPCHRNWLNLSKKQGMVVVLSVLIFSLHHLSFPPGVINTIPSLGSVGGAALAAHRGVDKVAFTGSTVTGRKVMEAAATSNLKKVSLELGGKSPHLIFESANIEQGIVLDISG
jgi:hypothetical protein